MLSCTQTATSKLTTPINGETMRSPLQDRTNMLISPFGMSPKAVAKSTPVKNFSLDQEEDDGYASAQSDSVDQLLSGNWKPNFDIDLEDEDNNILMPTIMEPTVDKKISEEAVAKTTSIERDVSSDSVALGGEKKQMIDSEPLMAIPTDTSVAKTYTQAEVDAMKEAWKLEAAQERENFDSKMSEKEIEVSALKVKESEYLALIGEFEATVTVLEKEKSERDSSSMEAWAGKLSELELANTRLRTERAELENTFQQLHKRYEQLKGLQVNAIKNEGVLKQTLAKSQSDLMAAEARFLRLKTHAQAQLDAANAEINRIRDESMKKNLLLAAKLSLAQTQLASLSVEHNLSKNENNTLQKIITELCEGVPAN